MLKLSRSSAVVVLVISVLAGASCHGSKTAGAEVDSKLKGFLLPKSKVLLGINLDGIKQTDFYKRHAAQLTFPQLNGLPEQIGMDPRRDLSSFLLSWDGAEALAMTRGTFQSEEVEKRLKSSAVHTESYNRMTLYGDGKRYVALLPKGVALTGTSVVLKNALTREATGGVEIPEDLHLQMAKVDSGAQVWLVSSGVIPLSALSMRSDAATVLSNIADYIDGTAMGLTLGGGAVLDAHISCISEEGAQRVHDALRGVVGLARLTTQDNHLDQLPIWDSIRVEKDGKMVRVRSELPPALADKVVGLLPSLSGRF